MNHYDKWKELLVSSFEQFVSTLGAFIPSLVGALLLIAVGIIIAGMLRWLILRMGAGIDNVVQRSGIGSGYLRLKWPVSRIIGGIAYWLTLLFFLTAAAEVMGLPGFADWLSRLIAYLPSVLVALAIIFLGFALGAFARDKVTDAALSARIVHPEKLGAGARYLVITLTIVIGLGQLGINVSLIEYALIILIAAASLAIALAFGLGAGPTVTNIIASRHLRRHFRIGQRVRIGDIEGQILEFENTAVVLDTDAGRTLMPAKSFQEEASVLVDDAPGSNG